MKVSTLLEPVRIVSRSFAGLGPERTLIAVIRPVLGAMKVGRLE